MIRGVRNLNHVILEHVCVCVVFSYTQLGLITLFGYSRFFLVLLQFSKFNFSSFLQVKVNIDYILSIHFMEA